MSLGAPNSTKAAQNNLGGISEQATGNSSQIFPLAQPALAAGTSAFQSGLGPIQSGTNFFNTLLNGNAANTSALLAPSIRQIQAGNQNAIQAASALDPRGGGRSSTLFGSSYAPFQQIQSLFNGGRTSAATALPQIGTAESQLGLGEQGLGVNLFNAANAPLATAAGASSTLGQLGLQQQQMSNQLFGGLGGLLAGIGLAPTSGGGSLFGNWASNL
jgi:hypothetical protein